MSDEHRLDDTQERATPAAAPRPARPRKPRSAVARRQRRPDAQPPLRHHLVGAAVLLVAVLSGYAMSSLPPSAQPAWVTDAREAAARGAVSREAIAIYVREAAARYGIPEDLVYAIIAVESEFDHRAVSRRGARGLMQLMPVTAGDLRVEDVFDPRENIEGGVRHLRRLMDRFDNDLPLVLAAYNAGERAVRRHRGVPPYRETRDYIVRVMRRLEHTPESLARRPGRS